MIKSRCVALFLQLASYATQRVERGWSEEERLYKHRNTAQYRGHCIDTFTSIGDSHIKCCSLSSQRVDKRRKALVKILLRHALHDKDYHIAGCKRERIDGQMQWRVEGLHLLAIGKEMGGHKGLLPHGAYHGKGGIKYNSCFNR